MKIKIFDYHTDKDYFTATDEIIKLTESLDIYEWSPVVWIGRFFCMDNDFGEHWFDNWELREKLGISEDEEINAFIVEPDRFKDGKDGPCHSAEHRKIFWTSVLQSLELDIEVIFEEARHNSNLPKEELEEIITQLRGK